MKKLLMLFAMICCIATINVLAEGSTQCIMVKNGQKALFFANDKIQAACEAAEDGDTLYFTTGTFVLPSDFKLVKKVSFIGAGLGTIISGDLTVNFPGNLSSTLFETLQITGTVYINSQIENMILRKMRIGGYLFITENAKISSSVIDRCYIDTFDGRDSKNEKTMINNTIIYNVCGGCKNVLFNHCFLDKINCNFSYGNSLSEDNTFAGEAHNSIIARAYGKNRLKLQGGKLELCLYASNLDTSKATIENCYSVDGNITQNFNPETKDSTNRLISEGYLSSDGETAVGPFGGVIPLDENYAVAGPKIVDYKINVNKENHQIKVTLELNAE